MPDERRTARLLTEADLLSASLVTDRDIADNVRFWRQYGSDLTNRFLDAETKADGI